MNMSALQIGLLVLIFVVMYMLMIRPQRKRQKALDELRRNLAVGDKIVTIGGVLGTIVKVSDDDIVVQVATSDKVKLVFKRWAISTVVEPSAKKSDDKDTDRKSMADREKELNEDQAKPARKPKRLDKKDDSDEDDPDEDDDSN